MALTKKQIKQLRAMANSLKPLFYVGKNDLTESAVNRPMRPLRSTSSSSAPCRTVLA